MKSFQIETKHKKIEIAALIILFSAALVLRWPGFVNRPYSGDEAFSMSWSLDWLEFFRTWDFSHVDYLIYPLYFALSAPLLQFMENHLIAVRVVAFASGVLSIPIIYVLLKRLFGFTVAVGCAAILVFNPFHVSMSTFARYYTLVFLLGSMSMLVFFEAVQRRSVPLLLSSGVLMALATLAHPTALILAPVQIAFLIYVGMREVTKAGSFRKLHWDHFFKVVAFSLLILFIGGGAISAFVLYGWAPAGRDVLSYSAGSLLVGHGIRFGIPLCVLCVAALIYFIRNEDVAGIFFSLWCVIPAAIMVVLSFLGIITAPIYLFAGILGPVALAVYYVRFSIGAHGQAGFQQKLLFSGIVAAMAFGPAVQLASYFANYDAVDYRTSMGIVLKESPDAGSVVITEGVAYPVYYAQKAGRTAVSLPFDSSVTEVLDAAQSGRVIVLHSIWLFTLSDAELALFQSKLNKPCWFIVGTTNGLDPSLPEGLPVYKKRRDRDSPQDYYVSFPIDPKERLYTFFSYVQRVGRTRLDHRHYELFLYRMHAS